MRRLLFLAKEGMSREQLKAAGAAASDSQILMLKDWGF